MSASGQTEKSGRATGKSALPSRTDIVSPAGQVRKVPITKVVEVGPTRSPRQRRREAQAAFAINYDGNPDQDGRPAGPALQV